MRVLGLRLLLPFLVPVATLAAGHDISTVRYVPPASGVIGATMLYDGAGFVTAFQTAVRNSYVFYRSRTDAATGITDPATPLAAATWLTHGFAAVQSAASLEVTDLRTGQVTPLPPQPVSSKIAGNGALIIAVGRTGYYGGAITASTFRRDGTFAGRVDLPVPVDDEFDVDSAGDGFAIVTGGRSGVHVFRIDAAGAIAFERVIPASQAGAGGPFFVSVASGPLRTVVAWTAAGNPYPYVASVSAAGAVSSPERLPAVASAGYATPPVQVVPMRSGFAVVWLTDLPSATQVTAAARLDAAGHVIDASATIISENPFIGAASSPDVIAVATMTRARHEIFVITATPRSGGFDLRPAAAVLVPATQTNVKLASDGVDYVAVWQEFDGTGSELRAGRVSRTGVPLDDPGVKLPIQPPYSVDLAIARGANGDALIVAGSYLGVYAFRWSRSAGLLDTTPIVLSADGGTGVAVAWNGTRYLVVWAGKDATAGSLEVFGRLVGGDGSLSERTNVPAVRWAKSNDKYSENPALAFDGRQFLLVAPMFSNTPCYQICPRPLSDEMRLVRLSSDGVPLDDRAVVLPGLHMAARVASSGSEFLVTFDDGTFRIVKPRADGIDVGPERRVFTPLSISVARADVVWDGSAYVIDWTFAVPYGGPSWLESVRSDRSGALSAPLYVRTAAPSDFRPAAAANDGGEHAVAIDEVTAETQTTRARIYLSSEPWLAVHVPPPPRNLVSHLAGTSAQLLWESDPVEGFLIERAYGNEWLLATPVDGTARQATVPYVQAGDRFRIRSVGPGGVSADGPVTSVGSERRVRATRP